MDKNRSAVICAYARSPFAFAHKGELAKIRPDDISAQLVAALIARAGINPAAIEDIFWGCAFPEGEQGYNMARMIVMIADLPITIAGATVNRFCGSSMEAVHMAAGHIAAGAGEVFVCGGVESMTRVPIGGFNPLPNPALYKRMPQAYISMGLTAENVAKEKNITRAEQEEFALNSHRKAAAADLSGEIVAIGAKARSAQENAGDSITKDGCVRPDTTLEKMATLAPAFAADGSVTAATSAPLTDGAAALLVCSEEYAEKHNLSKLARIRSFATAGVAPEIMGVGPVEASRKALARAGLTIKDIDIVELNEAFAAQAIACVRELGIDAAKLNIEGGGIALGHPLGASGARITGKAAQLLHRNKSSYALATMCIGGGQGIATVLEKI